MFNERWSQLTPLRICDGCSVPCELTVFWKYTPWQWEKPSRTHDHAMRSRARGVSCKTLHEGSDGNKGIFLSGLWGKWVWERAAAQQGAAFRGRAQWRGITEDNLTSGWLLLLLGEDTLLKWITLHFDWLLPSVCVCYNTPTQHRTEICHQCVSQASNSSFSQLLLPPSDPDFRLLAFCCSPNMRKR